MEDEVAPGSGSGSVLEVELEFDGVETKLTGAVDEVWGLD